MTPAESAHTTWQDGLVAGHRALGRWIEGRFQPSPNGDSISALRYFELDNLESVIATMHAHPGAPVDRRPGGSAFEFTIGASRFARWYAASVTTVAMIGLAHGVGLDLSPEHCMLTPRQIGQFTVSLDLTEDQIVHCPERPTQWLASGPRVRTLDELRDFTWSKLYGAHLSPLFKRVLQLGHVSEALLWTSAAEYVGNLSDSADEYLGPLAAAPYRADRTLLLEAATLPGVPGPNPLRDTLDWVPVDGSDFPERVETRRMCCLSYLLEVRDGTLCQNCPHLPLADRVALVRERHGVALGTPGGTALKRSQEIGRQRPSFRQRNEKRTATT